MSYMTGVSLDTTAKTIKSHYDVSSTRALFIFRFISPKARGRNCHSSAGMATVARSRSPALNMKLIYRWRGNNDEFISGANCSQADTEQSKSIGVQ